MYDFNKLTIVELGILFEVFGFEFVIEDGRITNVEGGR